MTHLSIAQAAAGHVDRSLGSMPPVDKAMKHGILHALIAIAEALQKPALTVNYEALINQPLEHVGVDGDDD